MQKNYIIILSLLISINIKACKNNEETTTQTNTINLLSAVSILKDIQNLVVNYCSEWTVYKSLDGHNPDQNDSNAIVVAFSPLLIKNNTDLLDINYLASGSSDNNVKIWDIHTGHCIHNLIGHSDSIKSLAYSPDGKSLASGSDDNIIKIWDTSNGKCVYTLNDDAFIKSYDIEFVRSLEFSSDNKHLASSSANTIKIWDPNSGNCIHSLNHDYVIFARYIILQNNILLLISISGNRNPSVKIWDTENYKILHTIEQKRVLSSLTSLTNGKHFVTGELCGLINIRRIDNYEIIKTFKDEGFVGSLTCSPDRQFLVSTSEGNTESYIKIWDINSGNCIHKIHAGELGFLNPVYSINGKYLACGFINNSIMIWQNNAVKLLDNTEL